MIMSVVMDMKTAVSTLCYSSGDKISITKIIMEKISPISKFLGAKKFLVGDQVVYVDFIFFELLDLCDYIMEGMLFEVYTSLKDYFERVKDLKNVRVYFEGK